MYPSWVKVTFAYTTYGSQNTFNRDLRWNFFRVPLQYYNAHNCQQYINTHTTVGKECSSDIPRCPLQTHTLQTLSSGWRWRTLTTTTRRTWVPSSWPSCRRSGGGRAQRAVGTSPSATTSTRYGRHPPLARTDRFRGYGSGGFHHIDMYSVASWFIV